MAKKSNDTVIIIIVIVFIFLLLVGEGIAIYVIFFHGKDNDNDLLDLAPPAFLPTFPSIPINKTITLVSGTTVGSKELFYLYGDGDNCAWASQPSNFYSCDYFNWQYTGTKLIIPTDKRELGATISGKPSPGVTSCVQIMPEGKGADWIYQDRSQNTGTSYGTFQIKDQNKYLVAQGNATAVAPLPSDGIPTLNYLWLLSDNINTIPNVECSKCLNPKSLISIKQPDTESYLYYDQMDCAYMNTLSGNRSNYNWKVNLNAIFTGIQTTVINDDGNKAMRASNVTNGKCPSGAVRGKPSSITVNNNTAINDKWYFNVVKGSYPTATYTICLAANTASAKCLIRENNFVYLADAKATDKNAQWLISSPVCN